jgi:hypothetical protein
VTREAHSGAQLGYLLLNGRVEASRLLDGHRD